MLIDNSLKDNMVTMFATFMKKKGRWGAYWHLLGNIAVGFFSWKIHKIIVNVKGTTQQT